MTVAWNLIRQGTGPLFDPDVVEALRILLEQDHILDADRHIGTEANNLVHDGQKGLAGVRDARECWLQTNQDVRVLDQMLERRLVGATHLRPQPNRSA